MNTAGLRRWGAVAVIVLNFTCLVAQKNSPPRDLLGGASLIFGPPQNPPARKPKTPPESSASGLQGAKPAAAATPETPGDAIEDALFLGNSARDRTPPDLVAAEKAYRLAWKLNPQDPRPYIGLGNVYFDQQQLPGSGQGIQRCHRPPTAAKAVAFG